MKKILLVVLPLTLLILGGCTTTSQQQVTTAASRVQQTLQVACPVLKAGLAGVQTLEANNLQLQDTIQLVEPPITAMCAQMTTVDTTSISQLVSTGLPALVAVVNSTQMQQSTKEGIVVGLTTAEALLQQLLPPPTTTPAPIPTTTPVQAPPK
mgnify:CR=1 FL=1